MFRTKKDNMEYNLVGKNNGGNNEKIFNSNASANTNAITHRVNRM